MTIYLFLLAITHGAYAVVTFLFGLSFFSPLMAAAYAGVQLLLAAAGSFYCYMFMAR